MDLNLSFKSTKGTIMAAFLEIILLQNRLRRVKYSYWVTIQKRSDKLMLQLTEYQSINSSVKFHNRL